jgi:CRP-like cAMP-binding protein
MQAKPSHHQVVYILSDSAFRNAVLRRLTPDSISRLGLQPIVFTPRQVIESPGETSERVYFIEEGMASMVARFLDSDEIEVASFGIRSVIGVDALLGRTQASNPLFTQIAGHGYYCSVSSAKSEFDLSATFRAECLRQMHTQLVQARQTSACNTKHELDQRLARKLLMCADCTGTKILQLNQKALAEMLGCRRSTLTVTIGLLRRAGLVKLGRGVVHLLDISTLQKRACECYLIMRQSI